MSLTEQILQSLRTNIEYGAGRWVSEDGIVEITWLPDEDDGRGGKGKGYIDIINPDPKKYKGARGFFQLQKAALPILQQLPEALWEFNPDDWGEGQKGEIYKKIKGLTNGILIDNPDMPNNASLFDTRPEPDLSHLSRKKATTIAKSRNLTGYFHEGKLFQPEGQAPNAHWRNLESRKERFHVGGTQQAGLRKRMDERQRQAIVTPGAEDTTLQVRNEVTSQRLGLDPDSPTGFENVQLEHIQNVKSFEGNDGPFQSGDAPNLKANPEFNEQGSGWKRKNIFEQKRDASGLDFLIGIDEISEKLVAVDKDSYNRYEGWHGQGIEIEPDEDLDKAVERARKELFEKKKSSAQTNRAINGDNKPLQFDSEANVNADGTITLDQPNIGTKLKNWGGRAFREAVDPRNIGLDAVLNPFIARQLGIVTTGGKADVKGIGREIITDMGQTVVLGGLYKKLFSNPYTAVPAAGYAAWKAADAFYEGRGEVTPTERFIEPFTDPDESMSLLGPLPE